MKDRVTRGLVAATLCVLTAAALTATPALAKGHDSNTGHKIGKAIQYPFRKAAENTSINVHRVEGRKSVVHRRNGDKTYRAVVTPDGRIHRKHRVRPTKK